MPKSWREKEESQYKHVKLSEKKEAHAEEQGDEISTRKVNKQRRKGRRTTKQD